MSRIMGIRKKWKWIAGITALLTVLFIGGNTIYQKWDHSRAAGPYTFVNSDGDEVNDGGTMEMRRATSSVTVKGSDAATDTYEWSSTNTDIVKIASGMNSQTAQLQVLNKVGSVVVNVKISHADGTADLASFTVDVLFSINEYLSNAPSGVEMGRIQPSDKRKALIMNHGATIQFGESAVDQPDMLNLIFGNARQATWYSSNEDIFTINDSQAIPILTATGTGRATLSVEYTDGINNYSDEIYVYVRPQIMDETGNVIAGDTNITQTVQVKNGAKLGITASFATNPLEGIGDKIVWVISKGEDEGTTLVRDSLGNTGTDGDDARLTWLPGEQKYRVDAKAGNYNIQFYVKGTYTNFDDVKEKVPRCKPVAVVAKVSAEYEDKTVTVNVKGSYSLAEAFNIPLDVLKANFDIIPPTPDQGSSYVSVNQNTMTITAKSLGTATITVNPKRPDVDIPGVPSPAGPVTITITVTEKFTLNQSDATLPVGGTLDLYGIIESGAAAESSQFSWTTSDEACVKLSDDEGQYVTISAIKETPTNTPVVITLTWRDSEGVHHTAFCTVTVVKSANNFKINPAKVSLEVKGSSKTLDTGLNGTQNITWLSSDTSIVKVSPLPGNTKATVEAVTKTGQAVVTAYNKDNDVYATCLVTVTAPITSLKIDKGTSYETTLAEGVVQLRALYEPSNATNTEMVWVSSNTEVATVDANGRVTLIKEGTTHISVTPKDSNSNGVYAYCDITIKENPIVQITPDVTELDLVTGESYDVSVILSPENPSDRTINWSSADQEIATVNGGTITGVSAGSTIITITGGKVGQSEENPPVNIKVNVRNRLTDIAFETGTKYISVGETDQLGVIFTPDKDINDKLFWKSSDESTVTVSDTGVITGIKVGQAMISCYAEDLGPENFITCLIYVTDAIVPAEDLSILPQSETIYVGDTLQMETVFTPANTTNQEVQWTSSKPEVATVDAGGLVTAVAVGEVTITAVYLDTPDGTPWIINSNITVQPAIVEATDFDVTPDSANIKVGQTFTIKPVFTPANTTNRNVVYQSLDESVAIVSENGVVKGVGSGDALIQCQAESGGFIATCAVHVENAIKFHLSPSYRELAVGKTFTLKKVTVPASANKTAVWKSSNTRIATVSSSGKVKGKRIGTCTITCTLTNYNQSARCKVKVAKLNTTVKLNKRSIRIGLGQSYRLKKTVWTNNSKKPKVKWKSSNKRVASVNSGGKVKAKRLGMTKVTVTTKDRIKAKATCRVIVIRRVTSVRLNKNYMVCSVGHSKKLRATVKPKRASIRKLKWSSSNKRIAKVNGSGRVTGMSLGSVYITVKATDGSNKKARCLVKVLEEVPANSVVVAQTEMTMKRGDTTGLSYSVLPNNSSDSLKFASDNKRVATVSSSGVIKAVGTGTANITILTSSGITTEVVVHVVAMNKSSLTIRQYDSETLMVFGTEDNVTWYSSNIRVATVVNGKVTGRGKGTTYIYAYVNGCKLGCRVTITSVNS